MSALSPHACLARTPWAHQTQPVCPGFSLARGVLHDVTPAAIFEFLRSNHGIQDAAPFDNCRDGWTYLYMLCKSMAHISYRALMQGKATTVRVQRDQAADAELVRITHVPALADAP